MLILTSLQLQKPKSRKIHQPHQLSNYSIEHTQTELSADGTLLHINKTFLSTKE